MKPIVKIPLRLAPLLGVHKSLVVRWNQGKRKISDDMAMRVVDLLKAEEVEVDILDLKPELERLIPYLYRSHAKQRKLRKVPWVETDCPTG
jgi:DNA-binding transcriptional regulator YdaS (Cro superfamily)